jgi:hypothetical protein
MILLSKKKSGIRFPLTAPAHCSKSWCSASGLHERFHAGDTKVAGEKAWRAAMARIRGAEVSNMAQAKRLLSRAMKGFKASVAKDMAEAPAEKRAYKDGKPLYQARADAIRAKGKKKKY